MPAGLRSPRWWPSIVLFLLLVAGLVLVGLDGSPPGDVVLYRAGAGGGPPLAPDADRLVDLNRASERELLALPGIGEERAAAIIAARAQRPIGSLAEAVERGLLPARVAEGLAGLARATGS